MKISLEEVLLSIGGGILCILALVAVCGLPWWVRAYNLWASPCSRVYNGNELIYEGNSYFYDTESRGTGTMFKQYNESVLFSRQIKEIISNEIRIETVECSKK